MSSPHPVAELAALLAEEARAVTGAAVDEVSLEPPANVAFGDLASNVAMVLAKPARRNPREVAGEIVGRLNARRDLSDVVTSAEVAGPGFINLTLAPAWFARTARTVAAAGEAYGAGQAAPAERILIEFVSANPTGPPHVGHARQAAYGDSVARLLEFAGHRVTREFYMNDYGRQMELFGASVAARYGEIVGVEMEVPEGGYQGDYVRAVARALHTEHGDRWAGDLDPLSARALAEITEAARADMMEAIEHALQRFRVRFDSFFSERAMHEAGRVSAGVARLEACGQAYRSEGALWFRSSQHGDEKDRVLERGDGTTTYLAADVAYHLDKAGRDVDRLIDVLGADHHGYVARLRAVLAAGGHDPEMLEVPIVQLVSLSEQGEAKRMSKRAGTLVTLAELLDDIGVDVARFFLVQRSHETALELDLDLAREHSQENPVYYVQYVHARVASILSQPGADRPASARPRIVPSQLDASERRVVLRLAEWPAAVAEAERRRAPHRVAAYLVDLAGDFHAFYHRCRVLGEAPEVESFRLDLVRGAANVVRAGLGLLGVEAPERM